MQSKKGVSGVVVTVLLILLSIAAIAIIGTLILNFIRSNTEVLELGLNTINLEVSNNVISEGDGKAIITVKRNAGSGNLSAVMFIFDKIEGDTYSQTVPVSLQELEYKPINVTIPNNTYITKVSVLPVIILKGKEHIGTSPSSQERRNPPNLLTNGDFEEWTTNGCQSNGPDCPIGGFAGYQSGGGGFPTFSKETSNKYSENYAVKVTSTALLFSIFKQYTPNPFIANKDYVFSSWIYCPEITSITNVSLEEHFNNKNSPQIKCDNKWHYHTMKFKATSPSPPSSSNQIIFGRFVQSSVLSNYMIIDKAEVHESI